jgi:predicted alpha-1,2-mannosidase
MRRAAALCLALLAAGPLHAAATGPDELVDRIDPFIGTGGHGHTFPGPALPFGMVQLGPDTRLSGWDGCSGYHFSDTVVYGFSHTHLSGTGVGDYGDILLMPIAGEPSLESGEPDRFGPGYASPFDKTTEQAAAGYYAVRLSDGGIDVELTATPRTGLHRYAFPAGAPAHVIVDLEHRDRLLDADLRVVDDRTIEGFRRSSAWARDQVVHFRARFSRPFTATRIAAGDATHPDRPSKAVLSFGDAGGELLVQVGISAVDADGARRNLEAEWAGFDFEGTRERARDAWRRELAPFSVEDADAAQATVLATALYHSFLAPNLFSDADGRYRGLDLAIHTTEGRDKYTVFSLWDTYRATHPLFTLVQRERTRDFVQTMLAQYEQGGRLPVWELAANETDCMIGYHSVSAIADAYLKGLVRGDEELALRAMLASAEGERFGLAAYRRDGYIGAEQEMESVSRTLEYAYDDACIARFAASLGRDDVAAAFEGRAQAWRHLFDPESRCFRPRHNGRWLQPFDPRRVDFNYTEANAWQYRFAAPHHLREHAALLGGDAACEAVLDSLFAADSATTGREQADITGLVGQYAHGNEPSHHLAWLSHFNGRPGRSAERVARIRDAFYAASPDGLIGNEDCGQMSSWYVLAAYGLYDVAPTSRQWLLIPPLHERMSLRLAGGRTFTTRREGTGAIERVTFDGRPLERSFLWHEEIANGGELVFHLGKDGEWGESSAARPGTPAPAPPILAAPWAAAPADRFRGELEVRLASADPGSEIRWTDDPQQDPREGRPYDGPLHLRATTTLRFAATDGTRWSPATTARFDALPVDWRVDVHATPNPQYTAGGPDALIDGRRGTTAWATGGWQGYQGQDFVAVLDLGRPTPVARAAAGFLQDTRSWIVLPTELIVETSTDGATFHEAGRLRHDVPVDTDGVITRDLALDLDGSPLHALRFRAINAGTLPSWHPGAGGASFIFIDELLVE